MSYVGKWVFHSIGTVADSDEMVYLGAEDYLKSPMPYIDETDEEAVADELRERKNMRTVSIFKNGNNRAIRLPRDLDFEGVSELEIVREGDSIILRPVRPTWGSFLEYEKADPDFMAEREDVVSDEGRFNL